MSAADRDHLAPRLIGGAKIMLFRFSLDDIEKELAQFVIARARRAAAS